jgi:hypothetical protein
VCPPAPVYRGQRHLLSIVADAQNFAVCDRSQGFAFAWIDQDAVEHKAYLRYHFLEAIALSLLASSYVTPLHAACVEFPARECCCAVTPGQASLHSPSRVLVPDGNIFPTTQVTWFERKRPARRRQFTPGASFAHLPSELFPELEGLSLTPRAAGKPSIEVPTALMPDVTTASIPRSSTSSFLNRNESDSPELVPFPKELALQWANQSQADTGTNDEIQAAIRELLNAQLFELRYRTLDGAVASA